MQSFCVVAFGSTLAATALPLSVSGHLPVLLLNAPNSVRGENQVPAMLVAVAVPALYDAARSDVQREVGPVPLLEIFSQQDCGVGPGRVAHDGHDITDSQRTAGETEPVQHGCSARLDLDVRGGPVRVPHLHCQVDVRVCEPVLTDRPRHRDFFLGLVGGGAVVRQRRRHERWQRG